MPSRAILQVCCPGTCFPLCTLWFCLLTTQEHSPCLGLSHFSHQPTPSSPTQTQYPQPSIHCSVAAGDPDHFYRTCKMDLNVSLRQAFSCPPDTSSGIPEEGEGSTCTLAHALRHSRCGAPEDKACVAHFCQCIIQPCWWVPLSTLLF